MFDFCYSLLFNTFENSTDYVGECHVREFNNNSFCNNAKTFDELIERGCFGESNEVYYQINGMHSLKPTPDGLITIAS